MKRLTTALLLTVFTVSGIGTMAPVIAAEHGQQGKHMMHGKGQGMMHGKGQGMMHGKGHGMMHGKKHGKCHDGDWKSTLTDEQQKQVTRLKIDYKKKMYPVKAKMRHTKVELVLLVTADNPNQADIDKNIDELAKLKAEKMRLKTAHKIAVRKVLNVEQRQEFDMHMLKKAYHGDKGHGKKGRHGHH